ncbi:MAG: hypothetical protein HZC48_08170 [Nitrospirae bacterium]|nr:hypothetical protein [Nitrospirota bacterium]
MTDELKVEYDQCFDNWRFLVGLRFTVLAFFLTLTSALLYAVFTQPIFNNKPYQYLVSIIGIVSSWAIIMLEGRNRQLYDVCINRAKAIEKQFYTTQGQQQSTVSDNCLAHLLYSAPRQFWAWHTGAIYILYAIAFLIWLGLLFTASCGGFPIQPVTTHGTG